MNSDKGWRDPRTGRVSGFQSAEQRHNFMIGRARFCDGPNRQMPRCTALNRLGECCKAARMRGRSTCFRHGGTAAAKRDRLAAAHLSGDVDRIQRAEMRSERNRLRALWRRDPSEPGRTIMLESADEADCKVWAARQGFQLDVLDNSLPAFADVVRWTWARMSRGLICDSDLNRKVRQLHSRIMEASRSIDHSG
jgi:hypothetical protein